MIHPRGREQGKRPRDWASLGPVAAKGVRDRAVRGEGSKGANETRCQTKTEGKE